MNERYNLTCSECGHDFSAAPSLSMRGFGENSGHGSCPACKTFLHLEIYPDLNGSTMVSMLHSQWVESQAVQK